MCEIRLDLSRLYRYFIDRLIFRKLSNTQYYRFAEFSRFDRIRKSKM